MRLVDLAVPLTALAALFAAAPLAANQVGIVRKAAPPSAAVSVAPLAADEVLLEVDATGKAVVSGDLVTLRIVVAAAKPSAREARAAVVAQAERVAAALRTAGVAAQDVRILETGRNVAMFGGDEALAIMSEGQAQQATPSTDSRTIDVRLRNPARFERLREAAEAAGASSVSRPAYALNDEVPVRTAARADAVRKAREEAAAYAQVLGMKVGRILRVSERGVDQTLAQMQLMMRSLGMADGVDEGQVSVQVTVSVDFALVPAR
jgi:uncharacterized protein YggE